MQESHFKTAWSDVKASPGWLKKSVQLALVCLIPVFGVMVMLGYLFGWARDIAWNLHRPLPKRILENEDGRLYSRGFYAMLIGFVFLLPSYAIEILSGLFGNVGYLAFGGGGFFWSGALLTAVAFIVLRIAVAVAATPFLWVGTLRMSVYGNLGAGFQLSKIWAMMRHDLRGLLRIVVAALLLGLGIALVVALAAILVNVLVMSASVRSFHAPVGSSHAGVAGSFGMSLGMSFLFTCIFFIIALWGVVLVQMVSVRALGYWLRQFDLPSWGGQEDPLPFEPAASKPTQHVAGPPLGGPAPSAPAVTGDAAASAEGPRAGQDAPAPGEHREASAPGEQSEAPAQGEKPR